MDGDRRPTPLDETLTETSCHEGELGGRYLSKRKMYRNLKGQTRISPLKSRNTEIRMSRGKVPGCGILLKRRDCLHRYTYSFEYNESVLEWVVDVNTPVCTVFDSPHNKHQSCTSENLYFRILFRYSGWREIIHEIAPVSRFPDL